MAVGLWFACKPVRVTFAFTDEERGLDALQIDSYLFGAQKQRPLPSGSVTANSRSPHV
jgi:hypothetical protein